MLYVNIIKDIESYYKKLLEVANQVFEDQFNSMKHITKMLMDLSLSVLLRIHMWLAERGINKMEVKGN